MTEPKFKVHEIIDIGNSSIVLVTLPDGKLISVSEDNIMEIEEVKDV